MLLGSILNLLNMLDILIQQCSQDQNIPFTTINNELNLLVNQSTGISNSVVIATDNTYKGFALEIKLDETNTTQYKKRYAQALNRQGVPVLKTESSFASDPQVLIDQLKFIIDSNPNLTAE
jgi:formyltetrahydrofolate synthetase